MQKPGLILCCQLDNSFKLDHGTSVRYGAGGPYERSSSLPSNRKSKYPGLHHRKIMNWQVCITLASLPLAYPLMFFSYYVGKYLYDTNIRVVMKRYKELF
jgi:hypothetical protein